MASTHTAENKTSKTHATSKDRSAEKVRVSVAHATDSVTDAAEKMRNTTLQAAERTVEHAQTMQGEFDSAVRRNPTLAVLGALGVGVVLGLALNKRG